MDYHIIKISRNKKQYLDLLLLGDEQETMIDRYLERGDLFVLEDNGIKAVGVVTKEGPEICELKNIEEFYKLKYCSTVVYMVPRA